MGWLSSLIVCCLWIRWGGSCKTVRVSRVHDLCDQLLQAPLRQSVPDAIGASASPVDLAPDCVRRQPTDPWQNVIAFAVMMANPSHHCNSSYNPAKIRI
jgi:hypothetical protein